MAYDAQHLFKWFFCIFYLLLNEMSVHVFCSISNWIAYLFILLLFWELYIRATGPLSDKGFLSTFSQSVSCVFMLLTRSLKFQILMIFGLSLFFFFQLCSCCQGLGILCSKSWRDFLIFFFSKKFVDLLFTFKSVVIRSELVFLWVVRFSLWFFFVLWTFNFSSTILLQRLSFLYELLLELCQKLVGLICVGLFLGSFSVPLVYMSIQYHAVLMIIGVHCVVI